MRHRHFEIIACLSIMFCAQSSYRPALAGELDEDRDESFLRASVRIADRIGPKMSEFVEAVLGSPWGEQYGVVPPTYLEEHPEVYQKVVALETSVRNELQLILNQEEGLLLIAPMYGRFVLLTEREPAYARAEQAEHDTGGDVLRAPKHNFVFGTKSKPESADASLWRFEDRVLVRIPVFANSLYVGDLMLHFRASPARR